MKATVVCLLVLVVAVCARDMRLRRDLDLQTAASTNGRRVMAENIMDITTTSTVDTVRRDTKDTMVMSTVKKDTPTTKDIKDTMTKAEDTRNTIITTMATTMNIIMARKAKKVTVLKKRDIFTRAIPPKDITVSTK
ncbi:unnamed protein product [Spodoptera littoralis]|uniref:Uncharacterized protein n=1 Tax=Spodoptera littoralis TaxID=7109 RepID=A0A9P0N8V3_SPOLI|nr:unnamed protein product [Spodoptera littoralis]CAH1646674.1 unnamed protein product [Spodoptera littoralis]